ncbi:MAG: tRNA pseudouridine(13) synthase TruD [Haloferacaceae archaeon]
MREAHELERQVGIDYYVSDADGVGGRLRARPEHFRVRELERFAAEPVDADPGSYPHVVLRAILRRWDTNDFAGRLADGLGISRERVSWAGTKDKHAVTTQLFTIRDVDPDAILAVPDAEIEVLGRAGRAIQFGDLAGNAFEIVVDGPDAPDNAVAIARHLHGFAGGDRAVESVADVTDLAVGVPNVFGQQRFGSRRPITHEVGLALARGAWREAVLAYVARAFETEPDDTRAAREFVAREAERDDPDWAAALAEMPGRLGYERSMLHRLDEADAGADADPAVWRDALEAVPTNLQTLFVNAAQSYVYNRILGERLRRGLPFDRPVAGDVVCFADRDAPEGLVLPDTDRLQRVTEDRVDTIARHCERGRAFVTAPLVGVDTDLGRGEPGEIERAVLEDLGLAQADFDLPGNFGSTGDRRAILLRTDLTVEPDPLTFSFALPKGSYATVVLREFLKTSPLDL